MNAVVMKIISLRGRLGIAPLNDRPDGWLRQAYNRGSLARWLRMLEYAAEATG